MSNFREMLLSGLPARHVMAFYIGFPLALAYMFGLNHVGMARHFPNTIALLYWAGIMVPYWLVLEACSRLSAFVLRPWKPPLWVILLAGSVLGLLVMGYYVSWYGPLYDHQLPEGVSYQLPPALPSIFDDWTRIVDYSPIPLLWIGANYFYDRLIDIPRFRGRLVTLTPAELDRKESVEEIEAGKRELLNAGFALSMPDRIGKHVIALQAEDHYIRVFTRRGSTLIRYRLGDAIKELDHLDGLQVHRSFWVRRSAVERVESNARACTLVLENGIQIPVSRSYREAAKLAGVIPT